MGGGGSCECLVDFPAQKCLVDFPAQKSSTREANLLPACIQIISPGGVSSMWQMSTCRTLQTWTSPSTNERHALHLRGTSSTQTQHTCLGPSPRPCRGRDPLLAEVGRCKECHGTNAKLPLIEEVAHGAWDALHIYVGPCATRS
jgi:hypothetical protein